MAQIQQIQIKFVAAEDRLLMRVASNDNSEFRFWLTRRFVKLMWPALGKSLHETPRIQTQPSPNVQEALLAFEHQKAVKNTDFATPYRETPKALPLGDTPILLAKMQLRRTDPATVALSLAPESGSGIDIALNSDLLHSLIELIGNAAKLAEWELPPLVEPTALSSTPDDATVN